jgi:hypothetical protein
MSKLACACVAAGLVVGVVAGVARGQEPGEVIRPRYVWQAGMTMYYRTVMTSDTTVGEGSDVRPSHDVTAMLTRKEVYSVKDDGTGRIAMTVVRVRKEDEKGGKKEVYDSGAVGALAKGMDERMGKMWGAIVGRTIIVEITPEGRMIRQEGMSEMVDAMMGSLEEAGDSAALKESMAKMREVMKDGFKQSLEQMLPGVPGLSGAEPGAGHRVGEEWTSEKGGNLPIFGGMKSRMVNKIESVERVDGRRIVTTISKGSQDSKDDKGKDPAKGAMPFPVQADMHWERSMIDVFDLDRGRSVRNEATVKASGTITFALPEIGGKGSAAKDETKKMLSAMRTVTELVGPEDAILPGMK